MIKKEYIKPVLQDILMLEESQPIAFSVQSTGLGDDDNLKQDGGSGDNWNDALGRRYDVWDDDWSN